MPGAIIEGGNANSIDLFLIADSDLLYEEDLLRNPYTVKPWIRYIEHKVEEWEGGREYNTKIYQTSRPIHEQVFIYERACQDLPGSYKLWKRYLDLRVQHVKRLNPAKYEEEFGKVNDAFERALVLLNKMPRIWIDYIDFMRLQCKVTDTRRVFDRALRALPITQHPPIWDIFTKFARTVSGLTAKTVWQRYMQIEPESQEDLIDLLMELDFHEAAAKSYVKVLNMPKHKSKAGKSHFQIWTEFTDLLVHFPNDVGDINVEAVLRAGISKFTDQQGKLWTNLATYWITLGKFERARDAFEEGIATVLTVRDFTQIFDAYAEFEESIITLQMEESSAESNQDIDLRLMRFEQLMDRRAFLLNDVLLRQNPNNVIEWQKRIGLWENSDEQVIATYNTAVATIKPKKATGKFSQLWVDFATFYETRKDLASARLIMEKATNVPFRSVEELADVWIEWVEMELKHDNNDKARNILEKALHGPRRSQVDFFDEELTPQARLHKSIKLWGFCVDLEESRGTLESTKAAYDRIMELRIATPQIVVNYANFLEEGTYYEESFKIYERGVDIFGYPIAFELWNLYLTKFLNRYKGTQLERARDLFEQALQNCPPQFAKPIYLLYGNMEEEYGLARHAMRIYDRATSSVSDSDRKEMYKFYITKSAQNFGLTSTRPIYERAIEALPDRAACEVSLEYADMEKRLGEIDRARTLYSYGSQFAATNAAFWESWQHFEIRHGNEDTFKDMLRIKRSVEAAHASNAKINPALAPTGFVPSSTGGVRGTVDNAMAALEQQAQEQTEEE